MIKTIITMVVTAIAGLIGYLVSDSFRERLAQWQRDRGIRLIKPTSKTKPQLRLAGRFNSPSTFISRSQETGTRSDSVRNSGGNSATTRRTISPTRRSNCSQMVTTPASLHLATN